jgi:Leucine-rich repeat (LRR) protein
MSNQNWSVWKVEEYKFWIQNGCPVNPNVKCITVNGGFSKIISEIDFLYNLTSIDFSCNNIYNIPISIGNLENLKELRLSSNLISEIPIEIYNLHNLKYLDISMNNLISINIAIGNLHNLQHLINSHQFLQ